MKSQLNKILKFTISNSYFFLYLSLILLKIYQNLLTLLVRQEKGLIKFQLPLQDQSKIIDEAFKEIDKATEYCS